MKRNEFKLLIENWRKNFIIESPEDPYGVQQPLDQDDLNFASDRDEENTETLTSGDFSDLDSDDKALARDDHSDYLDSSDDSLGHGGHSLPSSDSEEDIDGFSGIYDDDPTYTRGDHSSIGQDDESSIDISDIENVNLFDLDEF